MFKYSKKKYSQALLDQGEIRIGTLYWYRDMEEKKGISDPEEGSFIHNVYQKNITTDKLINEKGLRETISPLIKIVGDIHPDSKIHIGGVSFKKRYDSPNLLIFCVSSEKSKEVMSQFEGADTCVEIHKPNTFFQLVTWELEKVLGVPITCHNDWFVSYGDYERTGYLHEQVSPCLAKTKKFEPQKEVRVIWSVPSDYILKDYYDLKILGLGKCCRILDV